MAWVRLDDGFTNHPKVVELSNVEFRAWIRLLCYCARASDPTVDDKTRREVAGITKTRLARFAELGLLDESNGVHEVHDWEKYQPKDATNAERQKRWRARKRGVTSNGADSVTKSVTPSRAGAVVPVLGNSLKAVTEARPDAERPLGFELSEPLLSELPQ